MPPRIDAVLFDLDNTLLDEPASLDAAFRRACADAGAPPQLEPGALAETVRRYARELWRASPLHPYCLDVGIASWEGLVASFEGDDPNLAQLRAWAPKYRLAAWTRAVRELGVDDARLAGALAEAYGTTRKTIHVLYEEVEEVLRALHGVYPMAIGTNGAPALQRAKIVASGLDRYWDATVISGEVGTGKPSERVFRAATDARGLSAAATVMVGDSLGRDVAGAQSTGIRSVWVNRTGQSADGEVVPTWDVRNLRSLLDLLTR